MFSCNQSKVRHHSQCLKSRLALQEEGNFDELICEGRAIQQSSHSTTTQHIDSARRFAQMMYEGNVKSALRMTSTRGKFTTEEMRIFESPFKESTKELYSLWLATFYPQKSHETESVLENKIHVQPHSVTVVLRFSQVKNVYKYHLRKGKEGKEGRERKTTVGKGRERKEREEKKQVIRVKKLVGLPPPHSNYLHVFFRFRRAFAEVITFVGASSHEAQFQIVGVRNLPSLFRVI